MKGNLDRRFVRPAVATGLLLLIPALMTVADRGKPPGDGWHWGPGDFVAMALLLFVAGVAWELLSARVAGRVRKAAVGGAVALLALAVWVELAVDGVSRLARMATG